MATDATGTATSPDGLPTYNTAVDAPSGKGFNAAMAAIQTALNNRAATPAGILSGEAAIWNGTNWVRSSITGLLPSGISGYPNDVTKELRGNGTWVASTPYRKTTVKSVINTTTETDLLNGEISVGAGVMGTSGLLRLTAFGDSINNSGSAFSPPRFRFLMGGTLIFDTSTIAAAVWSSNGTRRGWRVVCEILNSGAANAQVASINLDLCGVVPTSSVVDFLTGKGFYSSVTLSDFFTATGENDTLAVNTAVSQSLVLSTILPTASASMDVTLRGAFVEIL